MSRDKLIVTSHFREWCLACGWSVLAWGILSLGGAIADEAAEKSFEKKEAKPTALEKKSPAKGTGKSGKVKKEEPGEKEPAGNGAEQKTKIREVSRAAISYEIEFPAPDPRTTEELLTLHNHIRVAKGLTALQLHPKLTAAAQRYAEYAFRTGRMSHNADGRTPSERILAEGIRFQSWAENMAWGQATSEQAIGSWLKSRVHHANILSKHTHVGFGRAGNVWVTVFAIPIDAR